MSKNRLTDRFHAMSKFVESAQSGWDVPAMCILAYARGNPFDGGNLRSKLGRLLWPRLLVRPKSLNGGKVLIETSDLGQLVSFDEVLVEGGYDLKKVPFRPEVVIDCGAHVGYFSALAAATYPEVRMVSYEPNPENVRVLRKNLEGAGSRASIVPAAVSVQEGEAWFAAKVSNGGKIGDESADGIKVCLVDLPEVIKKAGGVPMVLKVDIEGEERRVFPVLSPHLPAQCAVYFETHDGIEGWRDVAGSLEAAGFQLELLRERGRYRDGFALRA